MGNRIFLFLSFLRILSTVQGLHFFLSCDLKMSPFMKTRSAFLDTLMSIPNRSLGCYIVEEFYNGREGSTEGVGALVDGVHGDNNMILVCPAELGDPLLVLASYLTAFGVYGPLERKHSYSRYTLNASPLNISERTFFRCSTRMVCTALKSSNIPPHTPLQSSSSDT